MFPLEFLFQMWTQERLKKNKKINFFFGHLEVFEREDDGLGEKDPAGLFVDGGGDDVRVDGQPLLIVPRTVGVHLHRGVLGGQEGAQVFIHNKHHLDLPCEAEGDK